MNTKSRRLRFYDVVFNLGLFPLITAYALFKSGVFSDLVYGWFAISSIVVLVRVAILDSRLAR